jgi:glycosyltransferase involved in cell wall biosynthesis
MPGVSVIMPTCNRAALVTRAIRSVLSQSFEDLELIIVDDGSTDNTGSVVGQIDDPRIRYFRHSERQGGSQARNTGIMNSAGGYVAFIDDDDAWHPKKLALQVDAIRETGADLIYTGCNYVDASTGNIIKKRIPTDKGDLHAKLLMANCVGPTSTTIMTREILDKIGLFDPSLPSCQDWDLWIRISRAGQIHYIREALATIHVHPDRISSDPVKKLVARRLLFAKIAEDLQQYPKSLAQFHFRNGQLLSLTGNLPESRREIRRAISIDWKNPDFFQYLLCVSFGQSFFSALRRTRAGWWRTAMGGPQEI